MIPWRLLLWVGLVAAIAAGGWYLNHLITSNAQLREQVAQGEAAYASLNTIWQQERDALSSRETAYQALARRNHVLNQKLSEALTHAAESDPCVATPVPAAVDERLRDLYSPAVPERPGADDGPDAAP